MRIHIAIIASLAMLFTGCATIVGKKIELINIASEPNEAKVTISDEKGEEIFSGTTPTGVTLEKSDGTYWGGKTYTVLIEKEGYKPESEVIETKPNILYIAGNFLLGGLIGWFLVDPMGGGMYDFDPVSISSNLRKSDRPASAGKDPPGGSPPAKITVADLQAITNEAVLWLAVKDSQHSAHLEVYLEKFPEGINSREASKLHAALTASSTASSSTAAPTISGAVKSAGGPLQLAMIKGYGFSGDMRFGVYAYSIPGFVVAEVNRRENTVMKYKKIPDSYLDRLKGKPENKRKFWIKDCFFCVERQNKELIFQTGKDLEVDAVITYTYTKEIIPEIILYLYEMSSKREFRKSFIVQDMHRGVDEKKFAKSIDSLLKKIQRD